MTEIKLSTDRLKLRFIELSDLESIHVLHSLPETDEFNTLGIPKNIQETKSIIENWILDNESPDANSFIFAIEQNMTQKFIGLISIKLGKEKFKSGEVWYKLHADYWNKGYGTEALHEILNFGFEKLQLHRIEAGCAVDNIGSIKVLEKVGMTREGRKRQVLPLKSGWSDNYEYAILSTDIRKQAQ